MNSTFLLVSASMGSGHDAVTEELARRLDWLGHRSRRVDVLDLLPAGVGAGVRRFYQESIRRAPFVYSAIYAAFFRTGRTPRPSSTPLAVLAERPLLAAAEECGADAVVPVFHLAAQVTGRLRATGRLAVPSAVVVTDFAVHRQWLHPGNDLHLCLTEDAAREVRAALGGGRAVAAGPLVGARFLRGRPPSDAWARRLGTLGGGRPAVLVSAGAWGAGSGLTATARLLAGGGFLPVVLCGRNTELRRALERIPHTLALPWEPDMPGLLAACHALVDNAAGQTALEALALGVPVVGYRPIPGHGREGVDRMAALGLTERARDGADLLRVLDALREEDRRARNGAARAALFRGDAAAALVRAVGGGPEEASQAGDRVGRPR